MFYLRNKLVVISMLLMSVLIFAACSEETVVETVVEVPVEKESTLTTILDRGELVCGVNDNLTGFGVVNSAGEFEGFDIDFCKAVAAAILGDSSKVEYVPLTASARFEALAAEEIEPVSPTVFNKSSLPPPTISSLT